MTHISVDENNFDQLSTYIVFDQFSSQPVDWIDNPVDQLTVDETVSTSWHLLDLSTSWQSRPVGLSTIRWLTSHPRTQKVWKGVFDFFVIDGRGWGIVPLQAYLALSTIYW